MVTQCQCSRILWYLISNWLSSHPTSPHCVPGIMFSMFYSTRQWSDKQFFQKWIWNIKILFVTVHNWTMYSTCTEFKHLTSSVRYPVALDTSACLIHHSSTKITQQSRFYLHTILSHFRLIVQMHPAHTYYTFMANIITKLTSWVLATKSEKLVFYFSVFI